MEMTVEHEDGPASVSTLIGAVLGFEEVYRALGGPPGNDIRAGADENMAAANFLAYVMYTVQLANGLQPRSCTDFTPGPDRGSELARRILTAGTVEVCCDYCGLLMTQALARGAAAQMAAIHGQASAAEQWLRLAHALSGPAGYEISRPQ